MRSSLRRTTVIVILLGVLLVPGLLQAKAPVWGRAHVDQPVATVTDLGFFSMVWNLLTSSWGIGAGWSGFAKNGSQLDPAGNPLTTSGTGNTTNSTSTSDTDTTDNGSQLDPAGKP